MYGYVVVNKPELKFKEFDVYRSYYCGLCEVLKEKYGFNGQISISYDMTFLIILLTGLYEPKTKAYTSRCIAHPLSRHQVRRNDVTEYVADMNILMTYYKCLDDWNDERKFTRKIFSSAIHGKVKKMSCRYKHKVEAIKSGLERLSEFEKNNERNIDAVAGCFGTVMANMMCMKDDEWSDSLYKFGFSLGEFIYLLDAFEDLDDDIKNNRYNVLKSHCGKENRDGFNEFMRSVLNSIMAQAASIFEMLPIIQDAELLRNIIYSGVWTRFELAVNKNSRKSHEDAQTGQTV